MPVQPCSSKGMPGYRYGEGGFCYTYTASSEHERKMAKHKAYLQGVAIAHRSGEEPPDESEGR
jgi:hypothetical protein